MGNATHDKTENTTTWARLAAMLAVVAALATGLAVGTPSAALAAGGEDARAEVVAGAEAAEPSKEGSLSTGTGGETGRDVEGDERNGSGQRRKGNATGLRQSGFTPIDAIILAVVVCAMTAAIKSLAKRGARACAGNCAACVDRCDAPSLARRLEDDEELQAKLRELKTNNES